MTCSCKLTLRSPITRTAWVARATRPSLLMGRSSSPLPSSSCTYSTSFTHCDNTGLDTVSPTESWEQKVTNCFSASLSPLLYLSEIKAFNEMTLPSVVPGAAWSAANSASAPPSPTDSQRRVLQVLGLVGADEEHGDHTARVQIITPRAEGAEEEEDAFEREVAAVMARGKEAVAHRVRPSSAAVIRPSSAAVAARRSPAPEVDARPRPRSALPTREWGVQPSPVVTLDPLKGSSAKGKKMIEQLQRRDELERSWAKSMELEASQRSDLKPALIRRPASASRARGAVGQRRQLDVTMSSARGAMSDLPDASILGLTGDSTVDPELLAMQSEQVRLAAGVRQTKDRVDTAGSAWERTGQVIRGLRGMMESFDASISGEAGAGMEEYSATEAQMDLKWAQRDIEGQLPSEASSEVSPCSTPSEELSMELTAEQREERRHVRLQLKREQRRKARKGDTLPRGVEVKPHSEEESIVINTVPLKQMPQRRPSADAQGDGPPPDIVMLPIATQPEDHVLKMARRGSLGGASAMFASRTTVQGTKRHDRWKPCFSRLDGAEQSIHKLEQYWAQQRGRDQQELTHPPEITKESKDDALREGLGNEADEIAEFITKWAKEMERRLGVLITYEQVKLQEKTYEREARGTQVDEALLAPLSPGQSPPLAPQGDDSLPHNSSFHSVPARRRNTMPRRASTQMFASEMGGPGGQAAGSGVLSLEEEQSRAHTGFQRAMVRVRAVMRVQSVWRGFLDRSVVGNIPRSDITFFHSRDPRIRQAWIKCCSGHNRPRRPQRWLTNLVTKALTAKISHDFVRLQDKLAVFTFSDFLFEHLFQSYERQEVVEEEVRCLLASLDRLGGLDYMYAIVTNMLMTFWDARYSDCLTRAIVYVDGEVTRREPNFINPEPELELDVTLSLGQIKSVMRKLFLTGLGRSKTTVLIDEVVRRCLDIQERRNGPVEGRTTRNLQATQKEFLYAMLLSLDPDSLAAAGFGEAPKERPGREDFELGD
eukprot:Hpha_TRINITY_DN15556_c1_g1::TRINITY_DN15556_c1_g1_i1::g.106820::m.106820